ncbi:MAG TPA: protoporphyrinogen oxidase [Longimicrobiales bacterium]
MVVIIGAGITGLALAHYLAEHGIEHVVLEAEAVPGGAIRTVRDGVRVLEAGPQRTRATPELDRLVAELGLEADRIEAPAGLPLLVYHQGTLHRVPLDPRQALRSTLFSWRGKLRLVTEPLTRGPRRHETVAAYLARKLGREAYERLAGPLFGGLYASDPADMLVRHALAGLLRELGVRRSLTRALRRRGRGGGAGRVLSFRQGMQSLTDALHERHRERIRLGTRVRAIRAAGARLVVEDGRERLEASDVVLTTPADVSAALLREVAPAAADRLAQLRYNRVAIVHLLSGARLEGSGYQVAFGERLETRGVTFNTNLFSREGVYTAFLGGARNPALADWPDFRIGAIAAAEFELVTGAEARVLHVSRARLPAWDRSWTALEGLELPPGIHLAANYESRMGIPGRIARARQLAETLAAGGRAAG